MFKIYQRNPTLENTRIYLHTPEAIESLRAQAEAEAAKIAAIAKLAAVAFKLAKAIAPTATTS